MAASSPFGEHSNELTWHTNEHVLEGGSTSRGPSGDLDGLEHSQYAQQHDCVTLEAEAADRYSLEKGSVLLKLPGISRI